jgi:choline dehydrogenase-like flavoprotein
MAATARCKWRNSAPRPITEDFVRAAMDRGYQRNHDFNGRQEGVGHYQVTQFHGGARNGERCSAAAAYLHPVMDQRRNLTVLTNTQATRVLFDGRRATGVEIRRDGALTLVRAARACAAARSTRRSC